jgi:hypothetical protein
MKIGEIKVEAIKLMFANYGYDIQVDDIQRLLSDENYSSYIVNMNGAIARALDRIENACVLPLKSYKVNPADISHGKAFMRFNLALISDLFMIDRVVIEGACEYDANAEYELEADNLVLANSNSDITIIYYPSVKTVDSNVSDGDELWIPDKIARLIPYFIKGDLFQEEEPDLAAAARNLFEASLDDMKPQNQNKQNFVKQVYRLY